MSVCVLRVLGVLALSALVLVPSAQGKSKTKAKPEPAAAAPAASAADRAAPAGPDSDSSPSGAGPTSPAASEGTSTPTTASSAADAGVSIQPKRKLTKAEIDESKAQAATAFQTGKYSAAAELLLRVYEADPQPLYLFNAGQSYRKGDKPLEAKNAYEQFLRVAPDHRLAPEVVGYIRDMEAILATQKKAQEISFELDKEKAEANSARQALQAERAPLYKKPLFWATVAGGVVVVATIGIVVFAIQAQGFSDLGNRRVK